MLRVPVHLLCKVSSMLSPKLPCALPYQSLTIRPSPPSHVLQPRSHTASPSHSARRTILAPHSIQGCYISVAKNCQNRKNHSINQSLEKAFASFNIHCVGMHNRSLPIAQVFAPQFLKPATMLHCQPPAPRRHPLRSVHRSS